MEIRFDSLNLGGIADSKYQGTKNSVAKAIGFDLHSEPGIIKVNQRLVAETSTTGFAKVMVPCSDGNTYIFTDTGSVYKRTGAGSFTTLTALASGVMDAIEFEGYIYYSRATALGRWQINTDWSTRNDSFAVLTNSTDHPMYVLNLIMYIGNKNLVSQVEAGVFTADALDLETQYKITSFGEMGSDLLIGTYVSDNVSKTRIFRWNTWSVSFSSSDPIPEVGVNSFLVVDNYVLVQAGQKGNLYYYNGETLKRYKRIPGDWSSNNNAICNPNASDNFIGLPLFGMSKVSGTPTCPLGVYSFGSYSENYPEILNLEYVISEGVTADIEIGAVLCIGNDVLVSWKHNSTYGIDRLDWTAKYNGANFETRVLQLERDKLKGGTLIVPYRTLPANTSIEIYVSINDAAYTQLDTLTDTAHKFVSLKNRLPDASTMQVKVRLVSSGNTAPEIEGLIYRING